MPALALVELLQASHGASFLLWTGYAALWGWAIHVIRSDSAQVIPLILASMSYIGALVVVEELLGAEVTAFDLTSTFGLMIVLSVLAGGLVAGSRLVWAAGLAISVATWVAIVGFLSGESTSTIGMRMVVALAGVIFAIALVSDLFDRLDEAIKAHQRSARLQDAIASCSEALLVHSDEFAVYEAVRALLDATEADYAYVDRTVTIDGEPSWEIIADAYTSLNPKGTWKRGSYRAIPDVYATLLGGNAVVVRPDQLNTAEGALYREDGILAEVSVPVFVGSVFRGSVGFIQYTEDRVWTESEIQTLWRAAQMISAYWKRQDDAAQLRESNESKDRLLASVSHEIRTPLTAIVGLSEMLVASRDQLGDSELDELNGIIAIQSRELAELVEDLLVASRADFGNLSIKLEEVDLGEQVARVVEGVGESHPSYKEVVIEGEAIAWADPLRVRQVIRNLLTNAVKYGGDRIVISMAAVDGQALISVSDDGIGVPEAETQLIFERYYRSAQSPTQPGSVGIGLPVSRQLAELMGGSLDYVPSGSFPRFEFLLPAPANSPVPPELLAVRGG